MFLLTCSPAAGRDRAAQTGRSSAASGPRSQSAPLCQPPDRAGRRAVTHRQEHTRTHTRTRARARTVRGGNEEE